MLLLFVGRAARCCWWRRLRQDVASGHSLARSAFVLGGDDGRLRVRRTGRRVGGEARRAVKRAPPSSARRGASGSKGVSSSGWGDDQERERRRLGTARDLRRSAMRLSARREPRRIQTTVVVAAKHAREGKEHQTDDEAFLSQRRMTQQQAVQETATEARASSNRPRGAAKQRRVRCTGKEERWRASATEGARVRSPQPRRDTFTASGIAVRWHMAWT